MDNTQNTKALNIKYARDREIRKSYQYRLWRRTHEVLKAIENYDNHPIMSILDLGTADGMMLNAVHEKYSDARCVGVEYNKGLVDFAKKSFPHLEILQGDIQALDLPDNSFDVASAAAVLEHVPDPGKAIREARRILKPEGLLIITAPDPFWDHLGTLLGFLPDEMHHEVMNLKRLCEVVTENGFHVLKAEKFMLSPVGMPFEFAVEKIIRLCSLNFFLINQLVVAQSLKNK